MKQLREHGSSLSEITKAINQEARPRTGKQFYPANVARMLRADSNAPLALAGVVVGEKSTTMIPHQGFQNLSTRL
jgi:hypothetical protein